MKKEPPLVLPLISGRSSIRSFLPRPLEKKQLERILSAGRLAPSAKNRQPWRFVVIQGEEKKALLQQAAYGQEHVGSAGAVIGVCTTNVDYKMPNGEMAHLMDLSMAAAFMIIQTQAEGLGSCVVTGFDEALVREILTVPYSMKVLMLLVIGYPDGDKLPALQEQRKPLSRIISYEHW
ncbi:MAG: nitroreductase family protein [Spirochaetales bacterium]|jgi:nitroreductase|nr:nitroreductase family protein [Spirochaetales bacterium]